MSLLVLQSVTKRYPAGRRERTALKNVSLDLEAGEFVVVWGLRRSGRTTLLRVASGMEPPDSGTVVFNGEDVARTRRPLLGSDIGYYSINFIAAQGGTVVDHVAVGLLARGIPQAQARVRADAALTRVGAAGCADADPSSLDPNELARVGIARALVGRPRLLLLDDPANGVDLLHRDPLLNLIRSLADEGTAVLMTVGEAVTSADRVLSIDAGELRGEVVPDQAPVLPLRRSRVEPAG